MLPKFMKIMLNSEQAENKKKTLKEKKRFSKRIDRKYRLV